jgi:hypothetical protein
MDAPDYSYVGSGIILIREWGAAAPMLPVGNCSAFALAPQTNTLQLPDYQNPGGGIMNRIDRVSDWQLNYSFHSFNAENFARCTRGIASSIAAGSVPAEAVVGYKGGYVPLKYIATAVASVEPVGGGTPYVLGTDYTVDRGMLYVPATSAIPDPVAGAANFEVEYTRAAAKHVEGAVTSGKFYEMQFRGENEARSGKRVDLRAHKVSGGVISSFGLLGEEYGVGEVSGSLVYDAAKATSSAVSGYFNWQQEE